MSEYKVLSDYHVIEKSKGLIQLDQYATYGEAQYILLDIYMSQINPRDKGTKIVKFPKSDYEEYKKINRVKPQALDKELQNLMIAVKLPDPSDEKAFRIKPLFKECKCEREEDGSYWITMICEEEMNDYFFNISNLGYIKYRLGMMRSLKLPARLLYNELHAYKYIKPYTIPLDKLKKIMKLTTKAYQENKAFLRILKESVNEININTNLIVSYELVRNGNHEVTAINFVININENKIDEDLTMFIAEIMNLSYEEAIPIAKEAQNNKLNDNEIQERLSYIKTKDSEGNIRNTIGYSCAIMKTELWNKIKETQNAKNKNERFMERSKEETNNMLKELEEYYLKR